MTCDHLLCQALGATCELVYGEAPEGALDKHDDAPPDDRLEQLERELAAIDLDALRVAIRAERARRACQRLLDEVVLHEQHDLALTHDREQRARREALLIGPLKALTVEAGGAVGPVDRTPRRRVPVSVT